MVESLKNHLKQTKVDTNDLRSEGYQYYLIDSKLLHALGNLLLGPVSSCIT